MFAFVSQYVAMRVLSKCAGIGAVERAHKKTKSVIHSKKRNRVRSPTVRTVSTAVHSHMNGTPSQWLGMRLTPTPLRSCFQELHINYNMAMLDQLADPVYVEAFSDPLSSDEEDNAPAQRLRMDGGMVAAPSANVLDDVEVTSQRAIEESMTPAAAAAADYDSDGMELPAAVRGNGDPASLHGSPIPGH